MILHIAYNTFLGILNFPAALAKVKTRFRGYTAPMVRFVYFMYTINEPPHGKTNNLHR